MVVYHKVIRSVKFYENICLKRSAIVTIVKLKNKIKDWQRIDFQIISLMEDEKEPIIQKAVK